MMKIFFFLVLTTCLTNLVSAQFLNEYVYGYKNSFNPGKVTLKSGQVLYGEIKYHGYGDLLLFKGPETSGRQEFHADDVLSFESEDKQFKSIENFFIDKSINPHKFIKSGFAEILVQGHVNLYLYIHWERNPLSPPPLKIGTHKLDPLNNSMLNIGFLLAKTNENESYFTHVPIKSKKDFNNQMSQYFSRIDTLSAQIANGGYKIPEIKKIVEEYNATVDQLDTNLYQPTELTLFRNKTGESKDSVIVMINSDNGIKLGRYDLITVSLPEYLNEICVESECITVESDGSNLHLIECGKKKKTLDPYIKAGHISNALLSIEYIERLQWWNAKKK